MSLDLDRTKILVESRIAFALENHKTTIDFSAGGLSDKDMGILVDMINLHPEITNLDLGSNDIGDMGAQFLTKLKYVTTLCLRRNNIHNGFNELVKKEWLSLDLSSNNLDLSVVRPEVISQIRCSALNIIENQLPPVTIAAVNSQIKNNCLHNAMHISGPSNSR